MFEDLGQLIEDFRSIVVDWTDCGVPGPSGRHLEERVRPGGSQGNGEYKFWYQFGIIVYTFSCFSLCWAGCGFGIVNMCNAL